MQYDYKLRPHHVMCINYFVGNGYSEDFTSHMASMIEAFSEDPVVCLSTETDAICVKCPNNSRSIDILIRLDYFREFGSPGKLLGIYREFQEGASRFSKTHVLPTQEKRLASLRAMEQEVPEKECPLVELLQFEVEHMGTPLTIRESERSVYVVLEVDDRYSPKLRLYSVATGNVGVMKVKKI